MRIQLAAILTLSLAACTDDPEPTSSLEAPPKDLAILCAPECTDPELVLEQLDNDHFVQLPASAGVLQYISRESQTRVPDPNTLCELLPAGSISDVVCGGDLAELIPLGECKLYRFDLDDGRQAFVGGCR
jgi:hypothetical protein